MTQKHSTWIITNILVLTLIFIGEAFKSNVVAEMRCRGFVLFMCVWSSFSQNAQKIYKKKKKEILWLLHLLPRPERTKHAKSLFAPQSLISKHHPRTSAKLKYIHYTCDELNVWNFCVYAGAKVIKCVWE